MDRRGFLKICSLIPFIGGLTFVRQSDASNGKFTEDMPKFKGLQAKKDDKRFVDELKKRGLLIETTKVEHEYPHCWRCHKPVVFRLTNQWFFKVEDLKENLQEMNKEVKWQPEAAFNAFDSWLGNLRDNSITRQRYWGCPLPVWKCGDEKCGKYEVIGSLKELEKRTGKKIKESLELHIPLIDKLTTKCECGKKRKRVLVRKKH